MKKKFDKQSIDEITEILQSKPEVVDNNSFNWSLKSNSYLPNINVTLFVDLDGDGYGMVSVHTVLGYYELHNVRYWSRFATNEVVFFAEENGHISSLFVSYENGVSFYSNIDKALLNKDISTLDPALLLSIMQLSIFSDEGE
ncbi:MAG: hypothetical protein LBO69_04335 [Ignavibacteria bacterium]|jgi:hypothetical protein|nr:hypothetical protein [Ignavibacteria bacterium]